ncbi:Ionotropic receptor 481 [Blattella germanica]|nr:Ionotropic receptor 481 [Blattella germanica]
MFFRGRLFQIILIPLLFKGDYYPFPLDSVSTVEDSLSKCVAEIANEYFNKDLPTALFIPYREYESHSYIYTKDSHVDFLVQSLHQRIDHPLVMLDYHNNPQSLFKKVKLGSYIIILSGDVNSYIDMAIDVTVNIYEVARQMSPSGRLLIATTGSPNKEKTNVVGNFFYVIWHVLEISEAIVLLPRIGSSADNDVIEVYKWFPEEQKDPCLLMLNRFELFDVWMIKKNKFLVNLKLFQNNTIKDMRGCVLNISIVDYPELVTVKDNELGVGLMSEQLVILFQALNLRMNLNPANLSSHPNLKLPEPVKIGENNDLLTTNDCIATYPYFIQNLKWLVPAGALVPRWKSLMKIFNPLMWFCVVTTFLIGSTTSWLLLKENQQSLTYISALLNTLLTYLATGIFDRYKGTVASTFFVLWLFYCLIINTAYQSALISFLNCPGQDQPIKSVEELHESGLHLNTKIMFPNTIVEEMLHINNYETCQDNQYCLKMIAQNRNTAVLLPELQAHFLIRNFYDLNINKYLINTIDENQDTLYLTMATLTHGCLIFNRMEQLIHRIRSAGLLLEIFDVFSVIIKHNLQNKDPYVINLSHLQGIFYFLTSGLLMSMIVFLIEIMYHTIYDDI